VIEILTAKNTTGQYDTLISALTNAYIAFFGKLTGEITDLAIQKAKTMIVDNIMRQFEDKVHRDYMVIGSKYYKDTAEFIEFFPNGLDEYSKITKSSFEGIITRFIAALTSHQGGVITALMLADYTAIKNNYVSAHALQSDKKSDVATNRIEGKLKRVDMENELYLALLTITSEFYTTPEVIKEYFKTDLLYPHTHHAEDETEDEEFSVTLEPLQTKDSGLTNITGKKALFTNISEAKAQVYTVASLDDLEPGAMAKTLEPDDELEILISALGDATNPFLIIRNLSDELEAEVVIEWID
jgi:hypothetical protein